MQTRLIRVGQGLALILDEKTWGESGIDDGIDVVVDVDEWGFTSARARRPIERGSWPRR